MEKLHTGNAYKYYEMKDNFNYNLNIVFCMKFENFESKTFAKFLKNHKSYEGYQVEVNFKLYGNAVLDFINVNIFGFQGAKNKIKRLN